jgi:hypothetical protein
MTRSRAELGAENLLINCAGARPGDRLLIATEPASFGYFDPDAAPCIARTAEAMGIEVDVVDVGFDPDTPHLSDALLHRFEAADIILFLARLGDQLRFSEMPQGKTIVVSFALRQELLASGFGTAHHAAFVAIKAEVNTRLAAAREVHLTCPAGTDVIGTPQMDPGEGGDTSIRRFPMSVFTPVPAHSFSGRVAMTFLTGTGSHYYRDYNLEFDAPVLALLQDGRLTGFEGSKSDVARANAHYDRVARTFNIDRNLVHSWHAGIHPGCGYYWDIRDNYERWGGAAFGNPRILHFHTCGAYAPGEISWNVIDPTIEIDGVTYWDQGVFRADRLPGGPAILESYPCAAALFAAPDPEIGLVPAWQTARPSRKGLRDTANHG